MRSWRGSAGRWRPLYPVIYLDAMIVKVKDGGHTRNKAAHIAVGVDLAGVKHVLGIWVQPNEGASFWASVCADLANGGIKDVLIVCCGGLTGFPEAIAATWSQAAVQTCVVHLIRNALRFVSYSDRKAVAAALKPIYTAPDADAARVELDAFTASELGKKTPTVAMVFERAWEQFIPFLGFPPELRRVIYTTNSIESLNYQLRKVIKNRGQFPNDASGGEIALAGDLQHRGQTRRPAGQGARPKARPSSPRTPRGRTGGHQLEESPRTTHPGLSGAHRTLSVSTTTTDKPTIRQGDLHRKLDRLRPACLEDALNVMLVNARHAKNLPGRKTDISDAQWLAELGAHGLVRGSFVPPWPIHQLRDLTRQRTLLTGQRSREIQQLEKLIESTGIKYTSITHPVPGRIRPLVPGSPYRRRAKPGVPCRPRQRTVARQNRAAPGRLRRQLHHPPRQPHPAAPRPHRPAQCAHPDAHRPVRRTHQRAQPGLGPGSARNDHRYQ